jgi:hypothetical protein
MRTALNEFKYWAYLLRNKLIHSTVLQLHFQDHINFRMITISVLVWAVLFLHITGIDLVLRELKALAACESQPFSYVIYSRVIFMLPSSLDQSLLHWEPPSLLQWHTTKLRHWWILDNFCCSLTATTYKHTI